MTLQNQLRLMTLATIVGLVIVILVVTVNLSKLQREFDIYQSRQAIDKSLIEIKATALFIARADPILPDTRERLQKTDAHIQELHKVISLSADDVEQKAPGIHMQKDFMVRLKLLQTARRMHCKSRMHCSSRRSSRW
jgi:methyl-accepting chemotaxis protein